MIAGFSKDWRRTTYAQKIPDEAADLLVKESELRARRRLDGIKVLLSFAFNDDAKANGCGHVRFPRC